MWGKRGRAKLLLPWPYGNQGERGEREEGRQGPNVFFISFLNY